MDVRFWVCGCWILIFLADGFLLLRRWILFCWVDVRFKLCERLNLVVWTVELGWVDV